MRHEREQRDGVAPCAQLLASAHAVVNPSTAQVAAHLLTELCRNGAAS